MWPGNTADATTLIPVIDRLRRRFAIARAYVVADHGLISSETLSELEARRLIYILGVRERSDKLVRELVLHDPAPLVPLVLWQGDATSFAATMRRRRRMPPIVPRSAPRSRVSTSGATRRWSAMLAAAAF
jgi:hypothetical protein